MKNDVIPSNHWILMKKEVIPTASEMPALSQNPWTYTRTEEQLPEDPQNPFRINLMDAALGYLAAKYLTS